jgi:hypothetical protein
VLLPLPSYVHSRGALLDSRRWLLLEYACVRVVCPVMP